MTRRSSRSLLSVVLASMIAGFSSGGASAGVPVIFGMSSFDDCISVQGPADTPVDIEARAPNGELRGADRPILDAAGMGQACFAEKPLPFDTIHATWGASSSRTFTVPRLTAVIDRVGDVVKGHGPANSSVEVELTTNHAVSPPLGIIRHAATSSSGRYSADFTSVHSLRGGDSVLVTWTSGAGDTARQSLTAPYMTVWVRSAAFEATVNRFQPSTFTLRTSGGSLRTHLTRFGDEDGQIDQAYWTTPSGGFLPTAIGDRMTASAMPPRRGRSRRTTRPGRCTTSCPATSSRSIACSAPATRWRGAPAPSEGRGWIRASRGAP